MLIVYGLLKYNCQPLYDKIIRRIVPIINDLSILKDYPPYPVLHIISNCDD